MDTLERMARQDGAATPGRTGERAMTTTTRPHPPFRHEAVFYAGLDDFVDQVGSFLRDGLERDEPALVVVSAEKIARLKDALGDTRDLVRFEDMANVGLNPARIIPAWREFVDGQNGTARPFRGVGEPIWAERSADELVECQLHEALLNVAFADADAFWLVCPYDSGALPDAVLEEARRSHPYMSVGPKREQSTTYPGIDEMSQPLAAPLPAPPAEAETVAISAETLPRVREVVAQHAHLAGFDPLQANDLVFVANEIATNSVRHGGGTGVFRVWRDGDGVTAETNDGGRILDAMVGRERPTATQTGGLGLWLANQLCDLVQIRTFDDGSVVRVRMTRRS